MATAAVKEKAFRRVRSDDDILKAELAARETTAAVLVEILQSESKKKQSGDNHHHHHHSREQQQHGGEVPGPREARPRSLYCKGNAPGGAGVPAMLLCAAGLHGDGESEVDREVSVAAFRCKNKDDATDCAKFIATRLQRMGDAYQSILREDLNVLGEMTSIISQPPGMAEVGGGASERLHALLDNLTTNLTAQRVLQLFLLLRQLIQDLLPVFGKPHVSCGVHDKRWGLFQDLLDQTVLRVTRWICSNGGWTAITRSRGNSFAETPPPSPSALTKVGRSRVFSLSENGELTPTSWETRSACELITTSSPSHEESGSPTAHDPREEWCNIEEGGGVTVLTADSPVTSSAAIPVPSSRCAANADSPPFDRFRSGSLPASRREKNGLSQTSRIALKAYWAVACYFF